MYICNMEICPKKNHMLSAVHLVIGQSWGLGAGSCLLSFMLFSLHMACPDALCHCEEKQQGLPDNLDLNPLNLELHDAVVPGTFNTSTSALETNGSCKIDHGNLYCVDPTGSMVPSTTAAPTNSPISFVFNIETPSCFDNAHIHDLSPSVAQPLWWDVSAVTLSDAASATTNSNQQKHKSGNAGVISMCKCKSSNTNASTMAPSK